MCGKGRRRLVEVEDARAVTGAIDDQAEFDAGASPSAANATSRLRLRRDQDLRLRVLEDIGEFACGQKRIDVGVVEARPLARRAEFDIARMVLHEDGIVIAALQARRAKEAREAIAALVELAIGDRLARTRHDDGRVIGAQRRVLSRIHAPSSLLRGPFEGAFAREFVPRPKRGCARVFAVVERPGSDAFVSRCCDRNGAAASSQQLRSASP